MTSQMGSAVLCCNWRWASKIQTCVGKRVKLKAETLCRQTLFLRARGKCWRTRPASRPMSNFARNWRMCGWVLAWSARLSARTKSFSSGNSSLLATCYSVCCTSKKNPDRVQDARLWCLQLFDVHTCVILYPLMAVCYWHRNFDRGLSASVIFMEHSMWQFFKHGIFRWNMM